MLREREIAGDWAFHLPFLLQMFPALCVGLGIHLFPYSPRWLVMKGRTDDSIKALAKLRGLSVHDEQVQTEWKAIIIEVRSQEEILRHEHPNASSVMLEILQWVDLFKPKHIRRTLVALEIPFFQQVRPSPALHGEPVLILGKFSSPESTRSSTTHRPSSRLSESTTT